MVRMDCRRNGRTLAVRLSDGMDSVFRRRSIGRFNSGIWIGENLRIGIKRASVDLVLRCRPIDGIYGVNGE